MTSFPVFFFFFVFFLFFVFFFALLELQIGLSEINYVLKSSKSYILRNDVFMFSTVSDIIVDILILNRSKNWMMKWPVCSEKGS